MNSFLKHLTHLFTADAPKAESLLRPEIDQLERLAAKFNAIDLSNASLVILSGLTASLPVQNVIASGTAALKADAPDLSDEEAGLLAQVLTKHQANEINAAVKAVKDAEAAAKAAA